MTQVINNITLIKVGCEDCRRTELPQDRVIWIKPAYCKVERNCYFRHELRDSPPSATDFSRYESSIAPQRQEKQLTFLW
jgi:hypothetical protein